MAVLIRVVLRDFFRVFFFLLFFFSFSPLLGGIERNPKKDAIITYSVFFNTGMNNVVSNERGGVLDFIDHQLTVYGRDIHVRQTRYVQCCLNCNRRPLQARLTCWFTLRESITIEYENVG